MLDSWNLMSNWDYLIPPSRPSGFQLEKIKEYCNRIDRASKVAILGSTIEFRDLLAELGFVNIYIFERNLQFYDFVSKQRIYQNAETIVIGNWLETLPNYESFFSVILSDLTSGNVPYGMRNRFYQSIETALSNSGVFCDKILIHSGILLESDKLIKKYESLPVNWLYVNHFNCEMLFCSDLLYLNEIVDTTAFYSLLELKSVHPRISKFIRLCKLITPPNFIWYYGRPWDKLSEGYCLNLKIVEDVIELDESNPYKGRLHYIFFEK
jgi:hypothetical protein